MRRRLGKLAAASFSQVRVRHEKVIAWKRCTACNLCECHRACRGHAGKGFADYSLTAVQLVRILSWRKSRWGVEQRQPEHSREQSVWRPHRVHWRRSAWTRQIINAAAADLQNVRLLGDRQIVLAVDHRFALSNPALVSAPSKKLSWRCAPPVGVETVSASLRPEGSGRYDFGGMYPVKKPVPWAVARLKVVTPSGDPV